MPASFLARLPDSYHSATNVALPFFGISGILGARVGEIQNSLGRVKTLPPDAVKDGCGGGGIGCARAARRPGGRGWVGGSSSGGHLMGPLSSGQLRLGAEAALVSVRDLATDHQLLPTVCSSSSDTRHS